MDAKKGLKILGTDDQIIKIEKYLPTKKIYFGDHSNFKFKNQS